VKTDRTKRYSTLLNNGEWNTGEEDIKNEVNIFIAAFEKYILHQIGIPEEITSLWNTKRLQQLKEILDFKHTGDSVWNAKTNYMPMGDPRYRNKKPLPYILDIVKP
jgi:hypothetical protein